MITSFAPQSFTRLDLWNSSSLCKCKSHSHVAFSLSLSNLSAKSQPTVSELLFNGIPSPKSASEIASDVARLKNRENPELVLFLIENGFSDKQVAKVVKSRPELFCGNIEKIKPKITIFYELGIPAEDVAVIISNDPWILRQSLSQRLIPSLYKLKDLFGSTVELARLLKASGRFLKCNLDTNFFPNVEFLKNCGISMDQIFRLVHTYPRFFLNNPESMKKFVQKVDDMGVSRDSKMFIHALRIRSCLSEETWERKIRTFRKIGFSDEDIAAAYRNAPSVFGLSEKKLTEVLELLISTNKYSLSCITSTPESLMYSIEKRYIPRLRVLEALEKKNIIKKWPPLTTLCRMSERKFYERYVRFYLDEVGDLYMALSGKTEMELNVDSDAKKI